jgi:hypothetical protein
LADTKRFRDKKKQLGQFMTPPELAVKIVAELELTETSHILEPSFGEGAFLFALIEKLLTLGKGTRQEKLERIFTSQLYGVEIDEQLFSQTVTQIRQLYGNVDTINLKCNDFFREHFDKEQFDAIIGNPPFGGTFDSEIEDSVDQLYGEWKGNNLKKETYSFFIAKSLDLLKRNGILCFISSDTFLTINTMVGLRKRLADQTTPVVKHLESFSDETQYGMVVLTATKTGCAEVVTIGGTSMPVEKIMLTDNFSWKLDDEFCKYFEGEKLADYIVCSSGMTVGKNEYFIRKLQPDGRFYEPYEFVFFDDPITLEKEIAKARLGRISPKKKEKILLQERNGEAKRNVCVVKRDVPMKLHFPHPDYKLYNKSNGKIVYAPPTHVVYWKDGGDAVMTFRKNGNWYLHGVGGQKFFGREGLTWQLISSRLNMKYLPEGYILDSGAPCAFLRDGIEPDELYFIFAWTLTPLATKILKRVINHTINIQGKDVERLPYPWWVNTTTKQHIIAIMKNMLVEAQSGRTFSPESKEIAELETLFAMDGTEVYHKTKSDHKRKRTNYERQALFADVS